MELDDTLISQFAKLAQNGSSSNREVTLFGTIVEKEDKLYVRLDGSDILTPMITAVEVKPGERVTVLLKNHSATVTGNISSPAARTDTIADALTEVPTNDRLIEINEELVKINTEIESVKTRVSTIESNGDDVNQSLTGLSERIDRLVKLHSAKTLLGKEDSALKATIISDSITIRDISTLISVFGSTASLCWHWHLMSDSTIGYLALNDPRLSNDGFTLTPNEADITSGMLFSYDVVI